MAFIKTNLLKKEYREFTKTLVKGQIYVNEDGLEYVYINDNAEDYFFYNTKYKSFISFKIPSIEFRKTKNEIVSNYNDLLLSLQHTNIYSPTIKMEYIKVDAEKVFDILYEISKKGDFHSHIYLCLVNNNKNILQEEEAEQHLFLFEAYILENNDMCSLFFQYEGLNDIPFYYRNIEGQKNIEALKKSFLEKFKDYSFYREHEYLDNGNVCWGLLSSYLANILWDKLMNNCHNTLDIDNIPY